MGTVLVVIAADLGYLGLVLVFQALTFSVKRYIEAKFIKLNWRKFG